MIQVSKSRVLELVNRKPNLGTTVNVCTFHAHLTMENRPVDCVPCTHDLINSYRQQAQFVTWLVQWKSDAKELLNELLQGEKTDADMGR